MRSPAVASGSVEVAGADASRSNGAIPTQQSSLSEAPPLEVPVEASLRAYSTSPRLLATNGNEVVRLERSLEAKLPHNLLALPSGWTVDIHEREDRPACFHAYVSPLGVQYASVRAALESILEAPTLSDDALPPVRAPVPSEFVCPVSGTLLQDPVLCMEDGHTYERSAVAGLVEPKSLVPNKLLKALIEDWVLATNDAPSSSSGGSVVAVVRAEAAAAAPPAPSGEHASPVRPLKRPLGSSAYESDAPKRPFGEPREPSRSNFSREASLRSLGEHDRNGREGRGRSEEINGLPERWRQDNPRTRDGSALLQTPPHTEDRSSSSRRHEPWPGSDSRGSWASGLPQQQLGGADERFDHTRERRSERGSNFSSGRSSPPRLPDESRDDRRKDNSRTPRSAVEVERRSIERARNDAEHAARRYPDDKPRGGPPLPRDYASSLDQGRGHFGGSREGRLERSPPRLVASLPPSSSSSSSPMAPLRLPNGVLEHKELVRWRRDEPLERVRAKLLGDKYENINHIENECGVQLRLRGSSLATPGLPGTEQLHFLVRAKHEKDVANACNVIKDLLKFILNE